MKNYEMKRKKLEQEQLINSILNNKEMEHEALVKAAKEVKENSQEKIQERKTEILELSKKREQEKNRKELEDLEIQDQLDKWNEILEQAKMMRESKVDLIMRDIDEELKEKEEKNKQKTFKSIVSENRKKLEEREREDFRRKNKIEQEKRENLSRQWEELKKKQDDEDRKKRGQEIIDRVRGKKTLRKQFKNFVEKMNPFKKKKAIEAYRKNMDNYNLQLKNKEQLNNMNNSKVVNKSKKLSSTQALFGEYYKRAYIDHKKANENANKENIEKTPITFRGRTIG